MAHKLTIRRVGGFLPAISLVVVLLCSTIIIWLTAVGLPASALRYIEQTLASQGIHLRLDAIKLEPSRGLAFRAEGIRLYAQAGASVPLATVNSVSVGINASRLLTGVLSADTLHLRHGTLQLPTLPDSGAPLTISDIDLSARITRRNIARLTSASLRIGDIPVRVRGAYDLKQLATASTAPPDSQQPTPVDINALLSEHTALFTAIQHHISDQHWSKDEVPDVQLELLSTGATPHYALQLNIPRYDWKQFHFRQASANVVFKDDILTIHNLHFKTIDPDSTASLQGSYSLPEKALEFSLSSNIDLLNMAQPFLEEDSLQLLQKFSYAPHQAPEIMLRGDVIFTEKGTPSHARVRGSLTQENLSVGTSQINKLELSFLYHDGDFNIDKLELKLPSGTIHASATAQKGLGEAQAQIDISVQELLCLVNQFTTQPITLPQGCQLYGNLNISAEAKLTTLPLNASLDEWENFVPSCNHLTLTLSTDKISYKDTQVSRPHLCVDINDITQGNNKKPHHIQLVHLHLTADAVSHGSGESPLAFLKPDISVHGADIDLTADSPTIGQLSVQGSLQQLEANQMLASGINISPSRLNHIRMEQPFFDSGNVEISANSVSLAGIPMGKASLNVNLTQSHTGTVQAELTQEGGYTTRISATPCWENPARPELRDIQAVLPLASLAPLLEHCGISTPEVELPATVSANASCTWDREHARLDSAHIQLDIPELVRTPHKQVPFRGLRIPIGLKADARLQSGSHGGIDYTADLRITHQTGEFTGMVAGNTESHVRVTGNNSIRADVIDQLIDSEDAHGIIRDFRFSPRSRTLVTNIDTRVQYDNGIKVHSYCDALIEHSEYLLAALSERPDKTEHLRTDLGRNPYTYTKRASCGVLVDVQMDSKDPQGRPLKDKICITLTHPQLVYDNTPWLQRQKWKTGTAETSMGGEAVIIDVENSFVELRNIKGTVYPAYSLGMFYADIQHFMEDIVLPTPAHVETARCVFPIYDDCQRPMSGTIRAIAPGKAGFNFLGTTIPLTDFSGFIYLADDYVQLDKLNAKSWGGVLDATVRIGFRGKHTSFDGFAQAANMDLHQIAASYGSVQSYALCNGSIRFRSPSPQLNDIQAYGQVDITNGDLLSLSLFRPVSHFISDLPSNLLQLEKVATSTGIAEKPSLFTRMLTGLFSAFERAMNNMGDGVDKITYYVPGANHLLSYDLQEAFARFNIGHGHLTTSSMKAKGHNLNIQMQMDVDLATTTLHGNIWPKVSSIPTIIISPLTFLSDFMVDIVVNGPINDIDWHFALDRRLNKDDAPTLTDAPPQDNPQPVKR